MLFIFHFSAFSINNLARFKNKKNYLFLITPNITNINMSNIDL